MDDFITAYNKKQQNEAGPDTVTRPFIIDPQFLSLADRQELIYKYQYLEESIESLALQYRLAPNKLASWLKDNEISPKTLKSEEEVKEFEKEVTEIYKSIQTRLLGLTVLHSAKAWQSLAQVEEELLASLTNASKAVGLQKHPDHRTIASLANTHERLVSRHAIIQEGLDKAKESGGLFQAITKIERIIVRPINQEQEKVDE